MFLAPCSPIHGGGREIESAAVAVPVVAVTAVAAVAAADAIPAAAAAAGDSTRERFGFGEIAPGVFMPAELLFVF